jgi:putative tricarboxylic transport membrane protein
MRKMDRISSIVWLLLSFIMCVESYRVGLGSLRKPGSGFLFFGAGVFLGLMSLIVLLRSAGIRKPGESEKPIFGQANIVKVVLVLAALFAYALLMEPLGFVPATFLLFAFLLGVIEKKGLLFTGLVSLAVTFATLLIFDTWLKSQLPRGLLELLRL